MSLAVQPILSRLKPGMKRHEEVEFLLCEAAIQGEILSPSRAKKILSAHHKAQMNKRVITYADPTGEQAVNHILNSGNQKSPCIKRQSDCTGIQENNNQLAA